MGSSGEQDAAGVAKQYMYGRVPEWTKGADCKSAGDAYGGSNPPPPTRCPRNGTSSFAHVAQSVEHILGKNEVTSSSLVVGSSPNLLCLP